MLENFPSSINDQLNLRFGGGVGTSNGSGFPMYLISGKLGAGGVDTLNQTIQAPGAGSSGFPLPSWSILVVAAVILFIFWKK